MSKIFAVDLAEKGPSGWVVWDTVAELPLLDYGQYQPTAKQPGLVAHQIYEYFKALVVELLEIHGEDLVIMYEVTDWFQRLDNDDPKFHIKYKRERQTQSSLGRAESAFCLAVIHACGKLPLRIGVSQVRKELDARTKKAVIAYLALAFEWLDVRQGTLLLCKSENTWNPISHHVADAIALALVQGSWKRLNLLAGKEVFPERMPDV